MQDRIDYRDKIRRLRLIDDIFMTECLKDIECAELVLRIILKRNDIHVTAAKTQELIRGWGRSLRLDGYFTDDTGRKFNIEIQRANEGAGIRRARFHSSMLDFVSLEAGSEFSELRDNYVIFITEHDVLKRGLPLYTVERCISETGDGFNDGSHIVYVNGEHRDSSTELGKLMQDFFEPDPMKMNYSVLAERSEYFKEGKGNTKMNATIRELFKDELAQGCSEARSVGISEGNIITNMLKAGKLAFNEIAQYTGVSLSRVKSIADSLGISES